jgi:hypothetical protein
MKPYQENSYEEMVLLENKNLDKANVYKPFRCFV